MTPEQIALYCTMMKGLDKKIVHRVPQSMLLELTKKQMSALKDCAKREGIKWVIVRD